MRINRKTAPVKAHCTQRTQFEQAHQEVGIRNSRPPRLSAYDATNVVKPLPIDTETHGYLRSPPLQVEIKKDNSFALMPAGETKKKHHAQLLRAERPAAASNVHWHSVCMGHIRKHGAGGSEKK